MLTMSRHNRWAAVAAVSVLLTTACGAQVRTAGGPGDAEAVTVQNCGRSLTFKTVPDKVVAYDSGIVETMFALGLGDHLAGYVVSDGQDEAIATSPWRTEFARAHRLGTDTISKELILEAGADFVYAGWNYGFREDTGLTPRHLAELGIPSYVLTESCRNGRTGTSRGIMPALEALYTDLRNLGRIFRVSDRAEQLIAEYRAIVSEAEASVPANRPRPTVFLYDSGTGKPFTAGRGAAAHEVITRGGGEHIMGELDDSWTTVSWEAVIEADPDVIVINDYDPPSAQEKQAFLETYPPLAEVSAVRNKRFLVLPYAALVQGPRNPGAVRTMANYLNSLPQGQQ